MKKNLKIDVLLWSIIVVYTGIIYATLSLVSITRKWLEEQFGRDVYNNVIWVFIALGIWLVYYLLRNKRGKELVGGFISLAVIGGVYAYYLSTMIYPAEKIHFVEYGLLGALLFTALRRHCAHWIAALAGAIIVYWAGLGDEAIQWALPDRVGEIRDSIINLFSGILGIAALHFTVYSRHPSLPATRRLLLSLAVMGIVSTVLTALFIIRVHGFGYVIESKNPGKLYSSFSVRDLARINTSGFKNDREKKIYENEALRHLHQREFYFTNDFKGYDGTYYRRYYRAYFENAILETYYIRYMNDWSDKYSGELLMHKDKEVAEKCMQQPLIWIEPQRQWVKGWVGKSNSLLTSRVKSTIITGYKLHDLAFYCILMILIMVYFGYKLSTESAEAAESRRI